MAWFKRFQRKARRSWWWLMMLVIFAIAEDRVAGNANKWIDDNSASFLIAIRDFLNWSTGDTLGIAGIVLVGTLVVLMVWSFFQKDEPEPPSVGKPCSGKNKDATDAPSDLTIVIANARGDRNEFQVQPGSTPMISAATPSAVFRQQLALQGNIMSFIEVPSGQSADLSADASRPTIKTIAQVPITVEFNPENGRYFNQEDRPSDVSIVTERYREYFCTLFNESDETLRNVSCEVATVVTLQNRPNDSQIAPQTIHEKLCFDLPAFPTRSDFSPRAREKLWLFSRIRKALDNEPIRIMKGSKSFHDKGRLMTVRLRVTGDNYAEKNFSVEVWVHDGILRMTGIRPES